MFNRIISHDTFGIVKVGNDAIGDTKLAIRFCQFPLSSTKKIDKRNLKKKKKLWKFILIKKYLKNISFFRRGCSCFEASPTCRTCLSKAIIWNSFKHLCLISSSSLLALVSSFSLITSFSNRSKVCCLWSLSLKRKCTYFWLFFASRRCWKKLTSFDITHSCWKEAVFSVANSQVWTFH